MTRQTRQNASGSIPVATYAKRRGVAKSAVQKAIKSGRLVKCLELDTKGRVVAVFPDLADAEWAANTDQVRAPLPPAPSSKFQDARTRREEALAETAEMELKR